MTSQGRFQFLNLWDEPDDEGEAGEGEERERSVSEQHSVCVGPSQWADGLSVPGKCVCADQHVSL